ncbi:MAG: thioesterase [Methylobacterium sp.]|nr:MAG: thioesterase [Methylobacterium sp.]
MNRSTFRFFHPYRVRYSEIDGQGVVYNAHYLTFFDVSIHEYFRALNHERYSDAKRTGCDFHVVKASVEFRGPLHFDDPFRVGVKVARIGRSSVAFVLGVFRDGEDEASAMGEVIWAYTDQATRKSVPVTDETRAILLAAEPDLPR